MYLNDNCWAGYMSSCMFDLYLVPLPQARNTHINGLLPCCMMGNVYYGGEDQFYFISCGWHTWTFNQSEGACRLRLIFIPSPWLISHTLIHVCASASVWHLEAGGGRLQISVWFYVNHEWTVYWTHFASQSIISIYNKAVVERSQSTNHFDWELRLYWLNILLCNLKR